MPELAGVRLSAIAPATASSAEHTRQDIALRLLPFLFVLYIANYLDRTSVAYAAIGMARDLGFNDRVLGFGIGVFFLSYVALQIPGAWLVQRWSARGMISLTMILWGSLTALTALVQTPMQLYMARFLLGAAEAGFFPGIIIYLSRWFIQEDRAKATSNFLAAVPLSLIIGSPIAGWTLSHNWFAIQGWRWLFMLEGLPAVLLGISAFFLLRDWPSQAAWLTPEQQRWIKLKLEHEKASTRELLTSRHALHSRMMIAVLGAAAFLEYFMGYAVVFWLPTVLKSQSGFSDARVGFVGALPYVVALIAMLLNGWHSDKSRERRWHAAVPLFITAFGLLCVMSPTKSTSLTVLMFSMTCVFLAFLPVFWSIPTEIMSESRATVAVGSINAVASLAGFLGPYAFGYLHTQTGSLTTGFAVLTVCAFAAGILMLATPALRPCRG